MAVILYKITNLVNGKFYIGQTSRSLKERFSAHKNKGSHCILLINAMTKYGYEYFQIEELTKVETREEANELEKTLIANSNCLYPNGYNLTKGGSAFNHSEITKAKIGKAHTGMKRSKEARENMSKACKGRVISEEQKTNISNSLKGRPPGNKGIARKIICLDTGVKYDSAKIAAEILNIDRTSINRVASGDRKTTGGYRFKYE